MSEAKHTVERAIIVAAGIGKRLQPMTLTTPKPLVSVNGVRMIDTIVEALHANGIYEIYVVVGYLKEQFYEWARSYDGVKLIENPWYNECNNISSLYSAREHLKNAIVLDGDQIISDPRILHPDFTRSGYSCVWTDEETPEWLLTVEDGTVTRCSRTGGRRKGATGMKRCLRRTMRMNRCLCRRADARRSNGRIGKRICLHRKTMKICPCRRAGQKCLP